MGETKKSSIVTDETSSHIHFFNYFHFKTRWASGFICSLLRSQTKEEKAPKNVKMDATPKQLL